MRSPFAHLGRSPRTAAVVMFLARPYLRLHLAIYTRTMSSAVFPRNDHRTVIEGPDPDRMLFIGEIAVAGYCVLLPGMALPAQVAARLAARTERGCVWSTISAFDMTAKKAATAVLGHADRIDVAVVALGIPDVLMVTSPEEWRAHLTAVVANIRMQAGEQCRIVLTGIPPMDRFRPMPPIPRNLIRTQVERLNAATMQLQDQNVVWAPFPDLTAGRTPLSDAFSFQQMHALWARAITPHLAD